MIIYVCILWTVNGSSSQLAKKMPTTIHLRFFHSKSGQPSARQPHTGPPLPRARLANLTGGCNEDVCQILIERFCLKLSSLAKLLAIQNWIFLQPQPTQTPNRQSGPAVVAVQSQNPDRQQSEQRTKKKAMSWPLMAFSCAGFVNKTQAGGKNKTKPCLMPFLKYLACTIFTKNPRFLSTLLQSWPPKAANLPQPPGKQLPPFHSYHLQTPTCLMSPNLHPSSHSQRPRGTEGPPKSGQLGYFPILTSLDTRMAELSSTHMSFANGV